MCCAQADGWEWGTTGRGARSFGSRSRLVTYVNGRLRIQSDASTCVTSSTMCARGCAPMGACVAFLVYTMRSTYSRSSMHENSFAYAAYHWATCGHMWTLPDSTDSSRGDDSDGVLSCTGCLNDV